MKNKNLEINYDKLLNEYKLELLNKLRDFGDNYLKLWVPDYENTVLSILNLIYSVNESNYSSFIIKIKNKKELKNIGRLFQSFCDCKLTLNKELLKIFIKNIDEKKLIHFTKNYIKKQKKYHVTKINNNIKLKKNKETLDDNFFKINYYKKTKIIDFFINDKTFINSNYDYVAKFEDYIIGIKLKNNIISKVEFTTNTKNELNSFLIGKFCKIIKQLPIQEAYEHGVIKLEYSLRPKKIYKKIQGIVPAYMVKNKFIICKKLINIIWKNYLIDNPKINKNLYDLKPKKTWIKLSYEDKIKKINKSIREFEKNIKMQNLIKVEKLNYNTRLTVGFNDETNIYAKSTILLNLEKYIRNKIDKRIEVFYKEVKDINKLRLSNLPKNFSE